MIKKNCSKEQQNLTNKSLSCQEILCKQEIAETIDFGSLSALINLREELKSEKTNNKEDLIRINKAINERYKDV